MFCRCWERNINMGYWWIIRSPILFAYLVRDLDLHLISFNVFEMKRSADSHDSEPIRHASMQKICSVCVCCICICWIIEIQAVSNNILHSDTHTHTHNLSLILSEDCFIERLGLRNALWTRRVTERLFGALINTYKNAPGALQSNEDHHNRNVGSTQPKWFISRVPLVLQPCHVLIQWKKVHQKTADISRNKFLKTFLHAICESNDDGIRHTAVTVELDTDCCYWYRIHFLFSVTEK